MEVHEGVFAAKDFRLIKAAPPPDNPPLNVGDICYLVSSPDLPLKIVSIDFAKPESYLDDTIYIHFVEDKTEKLHKLHRGVLRRWIDA